MAQKRIALASDGEELESNLSFHFGRCKYYVFVVIEDGKIKEVIAKANPFSHNHEPGLVPEFIAKQGAEVIIAGGMGPRAMDWFNKLGIEPITTHPRKINDVLNDYLGNKLQGAESCEDREKR